MLFLRRLGTVEIEQYKREIFLVIFHLTLKRSAWSWSALNCAGRALDKIEDVRVSVGIKTALQTEKTPGMILELNIPSNTCQET